MINNTSWIINIISLEFLAIILFIIGSKHIYVCDCLCISPITFVVQTITVEEG